MRYKRDSSIVEKIGEEEGYTLIIEKTGAWFFMKQRYRHHRHVIKEV